MLQNPHIYGLGYFAVVVFIAERRYFDAVIFFFLALSKRSGRQNTHEHWRFYLIIEKIIFPILIHCEYSLPPRGFKSDMPLCWDSNVSSYGFGSLVNTFTISIYRLRHLLVNYRRTVFEPKRYFGHYL